MTDETVTITESVMAAITANVAAAIMAKGGVAAAVSDAPPVTSTVSVDGVVTVRSYSDGTVQRNVWETAGQAQEYANSVHAQEAQ